MYKIKAKDLQCIVEMAYLWVEKKERNMFKEEYEAVSNLRKELWKTNWDDDAELFIDELPF